MVAERPFAWLELKLPPPLVALVVAALMGLAATLLPPLEIGFAWRFGGAIALVVAALALDVAALFVFWKRKTTINPLRPSTTSTLVVDGVYRLTRNPMYLGLLLDLVAWAVFLGSPLALLVAPLFVIYLNRFQIAAEERALAMRFGDDYRAYCARVGRWLSRGRPAPR